MAAADWVFDFPDFDENAGPFYTTGTTGLPKAFISHRQLVLHTLGVSLCVGRCRGARSPEDVYMPITPMFHVTLSFPYIATSVGPKQVYPGAISPGAL